MRVGGVGEGVGEGKEIISDSFVSLVSSVNSFLFLLCSLSLIDPPKVVFPVISSAKMRLKVMVGILFEILYDYQQQQQQQNNEEGEEEEKREGLGEKKELNGPFFSLLSSVVGVFEKERGGDRVEEGEFFLKLVMVFKWFLERKPVGKK